METSFENPLIEQPEMEARQNLIGRIGNIVSKGYEHARGDLKTYVAISAASLTLAGTELATTSESVAADIVPSQPTNLRQTCIKRGLIKPQAFGKFLHIGRPGQTLDLSIDYSPMPEVCQGIYRRIGEFEAQLQDAKNHKRWRDTITWNENGRFTGDQGGNGFKLSLRIPPQNPSTTYKCTPGPGITHERLELRNRIQNIATSKIVAEHTSFKDVGIYPKPC